MKDRGERAIEQSVSRGRLEILFDGVFAIAMTILVLELKIPDLAVRSSSRELQTALLHNGIIFGSYIVSFVVLSSFWLAHNRVYSRLLRISRTSFYIHIGLLALVAFVPFCAHLLTRIGNRLAIQIYLAVILAYESGILALCVTAQRQKLFEPALDAKWFKTMKNRFLRDCLIIIGLFVFFSLSPRFN